MICEMCGKEVDAVSRTRIEGSVLSVCVDCTRFGVVIAPPPMPVAPSARPAPASAGPGHARFATPGRRMEERDLYTELPDMQLAPDWFKRIRVAREKLLWTPEELAKRLNEKKSVVLHMESGGFNPPDAMIRKIEHLLKIRLRADPEAKS